MPPRLPLIAIVGATGTGKSQLAVYLARKFNGEIINGDALQMYEGLPITTNKIPLEERKDVKHHLLGCIKLEEEPWTVRQFMDRASRVVEEIRSRHRVPILVGGTHYYTQSFLFKDAVIDQSLEFVSEEEQERKWPILGADTSGMLEELYRVDPIMAKRWHPSDRRKIRRSLEVYLTTGKKASDIYGQQRQQRVEKHNGSLNEDSGDANIHCSAKPDCALRYDTLIIWTHADPDILNTRLDSRVDSMVSEGMLEEVASMRTFLQNQNQQGKSHDQGRGIWIAIGLKELLPYITNEHCLEDVKQESTNRTKAATRQYAKRQVRWIRLTLQRALEAAGSSHTMFLLDGSDLSQWPHSVEAKALEITTKFLSGNALPQPASLSPTAMEYMITAEKVTRCARFCEFCNKTLMSDKEWINHLNSKGHKSAIRPKVDWGKLYPKENRT